MAAPASMPWSVKGVSLEARLAAKASARAAGLTVGEWLCQVIRATAAAEDAATPGDSLIERAVARLEGEFAGPQTEATLPAGKG